MEDGGEDALDFMEAHVEAEMEETSEGEVFVPGDVVEEQIPEVVDVSSTEKVSDAIVFSAVTLEADTEVVMEEGGTLVEGGAVEEDAMEADAMEDFDAGIEEDVTGAEERTLVLVEEVVTEAEVLRSELID